DPTNANTVYAAVTTGSTSGSLNAGFLTTGMGVWKSTDGGTTWTNTTAAISTKLSYTDLAMDPTTPQTLYLAVDDPENGSAVNGVYKTTNGGTSWTLAGNFPVDKNNGRITIALAPSQPKTLYVSIAYANSSA